MEKKNNYITVWVKLAECLFYKLFRVHSYSVLDEGEPPASNLKFKLSKGFCVWVCVSVCVLDYY